MFLGILGAGGYFGWEEYKRRQGNTVAPSSSDTQAVASGTEDFPEVGFQLSEFQPDEAIDTIRVTIRTGENAAYLREPVDVHLGFGFPLRLLEPSGSGFAAIPQTSSLKRGATEIAPGEEAWFEFAVQPKNIGSDRLRKTPQLLQGLKASDISTVGFASQVATNWELMSYAIELNGKPFASNDTVNFRPQSVVSEDEQTLGESLPIQESLAQQIDEYQTLDKAGFLQEESRRGWKDAEAELEELRPALEQAGERLLGQTPWFTDEPLQAALSGVQKSRPASLEVKLVTASTPQSGTLNTVYFVAGGKKFLLSSLALPIQDGPGLTEYQFTSADLQRSSLSSEDLLAAGIGVIGSDQPFGAVPDRLKLDRVMVEADGKTAYDSDLSFNDQKLLRQLVLQPPAHYDESGVLLTNESRSDFERAVWLAGDQLPTTAEEYAGPATPEPETIQTLLGPPIDFNPISESFPGLPSNGLDSGSKDKSDKDDIFTPIKSLKPATSKGTAPPLVARRSKRRSLLEQLIPLMRDLIALRRAQQWANIANANSPFPVVAPLPPPPGKTQISKVRIHRFQADSLRNKQQTVVRWKEENAGQVAGYDVLLNAVLPHKHLTRRILLTRTRVRRVSKLEIALLPQIDLAKVTGLLPEDLLHVFVEPEVIALDRSGKPLGNGISAKGPLVPLHHREWTSEFRLVNGPDPWLDTRGWIPLQNPRSVTPGFQLGGDGYGHTSSEPNRWRPFAKPATNKMGAWPLGNDQFATSGVQFSNYPTNIAFRSVGDHACLRFDSQPIDLGEPMRITGLMGFIDGDTISSNSAEFQLRVVVQAIPPGGNTVAIQAPSSGAINRNDFLRLETTSRVSFNKADRRSPTTLQLLNIPIPLQPTLPAKLDTDLPLAPTKNTAPFSAGTRVAVSLTVMGKQTRVQKADSVAIFGLRLVPDKAP